MIYDLKVDAVDENSPFWYVRENISENQKVLDVGCATGYLGEYLKSILDLDLVGVDYLDFHLKKAAERDIYSNLINLDLNNFDNELDEYTSYFDRIILCDILEHLNNPMDVLRKLSCFLKDGGKFLIDVPNISHASIKYNLLLNKFNYTPMGLLDETHIRFFTQDSIINDLSKNNFLIKNMEFIFLGPGQFFHDQFVDYGKYPQEIIDFIENDFESSIYQIFVVFEKSNLDFESLIGLNSRFKELNHELIFKKEKYVSINYNNPLKNLEDNLKEKEEKISFLKLDNVEKGQIISKQETIIQNKNDVINQLNDVINQLNYTIKDLNLVINEMKNSHSWKFTKPLRNFTLFFKNLKNR